MRWDKRKERKTMAECYKKTQSLPEDTSFEAPTCRKEDGCKKGTSELCTLYFELDNSGPTWTYGCDCSDRTGAQVLKELNASLQTWLKNNNVKNPEKVEVKIHATPPAGLKKCGEPTLSFKEVGKKARIYAWCTDTTCSKTNKEACIVVRKQTDNGQNTNPALALMCVCRAALP
jgi:hypothetical protein